MPAVELQNIGYDYPDGTTALRGLSLTVQVGERLALLGPNGAGKTTLARLIAALEQPAAGSVRIDGTEITAANQPEMRRRVQLLFASSDDQLFMPTVVDDVSFGPANLGLDTEAVADRVARSLAAVDATDLASRSPHRLSTGEKRRAALAGVLAMDPAVLVLDEPAAGLDPSGKRELAAHLSRLPQTQLVITHDLPFALEVCHRAVIVSDGTLVASGPTAELLADEALMAANGLSLPYGFQLADRSETGTGCRGAD